MIQPTPEAIVEAVAKMHLPDSAADSYDDVYGQLSIARAVASGPCMAVARAICTSPTTTNAAELVVDRVLDRVFPVDPDIAEKQILQLVDAGALTVGEYRDMRRWGRFGDERDAAIAG